MGRAQPRNPSLAERYEIIAPLLAQQACSNALLDEHGRRAGVSGRTLRRWLERFRTAGMDGLAARERPPRRKARVLDAACATLIRETYLQPTQPSVAAVHRQVATLRSSQGRPVPSYWSVWRYCVELPAAEVCLAREGQAAFMARFGRPADRRDVRPAPRPSRFRRTRRIAVVAPATCPAFWDRVRKGVLAARAVLEYHGTEVDWFGGDQGLDEGSLTTTLEQAIRAGYDAIGLVATTNQVCDVIWKATSKRVLVATFLADTSFGEDTGALFYHGASGLELGELAGKALTRQIQGPGKIAVLTSSLRVPDHEARRAGFEQYVRKRYEIDLIGPFQHHESEEELRGHLARLLREESLKGVFVTTALSYVAAEVIESMGFADWVKVVGFDVLPQTMSHIHRGTIVAAIDQDPFGQAYDSVIWLHNALMGEERSGRYHVPPRTRTVLASPLSNRPDGSGL